MLTQDAIDAKSRELKSTGILFHLDLSYLGEKTELVI